MTIRWSESFVSKAGSSAIQGIQVVGTCDNCGHGSMGLTFKPSRASTNPTTNFENAEHGSSIWFPRKGSAPEFPDVPDHIASAAKEAHAAFSIGAPMAAILMARTVIEASAKARDILKGDLYKKIDLMAQQSIIRAGTAEAAHEIRHLGNDMAHGDIADLPASEDVSDVLDLMDEVLNEVFQGPAKTQRLRERRSVSNSLP